MAKNEQIEDLLPEEEEPTPKDQLSKALGVTVLVFLGGVGLFIGVVIIIARLAVKSNG